MPALDAFRLDGRVALVTGASGGLGAAIARLFAQAGARLVLAARRADRLENLAAALNEAGGQVLAAPTDVTLEAQVRRLLDLTLQRFGRIDVLVNSAGLM